ncbi:MAG: formate/nitrite transporter family protein [Dehalococcoidia bacterium]|nr:formate/nitrite transporter family protein [Dehalococcoidia bacterium]
MTGDAVTIAAGAAAKKAAYLRANPLGYLIHSALAGAYVGFGIVLIFAIGAPLSAAGSPFVKLAMGVSFGVALSLVIFAGSELFTGNNMVMAIGVLKRQASLRSAGGIWLLSFVGNLAGSLGLAWLVAESGVLGAAPQLDFVAKTATTKMNLAATDLFLRGVLCNWLVCLAVWSTFRVQGDTAKLVMIFWCLFAFIGAGFEHSVANMTLLGVALLQEHPDTVTWGGFVHNLVPVTLGNIVGGAGFVGIAYWLANADLAVLRRPQSESETGLAAPAEAS